MKRPFILAVLLLLALSIPFTVATLKNSQDTRQRAQESTHLVCEPSGGMGNKFNSDSLVVRNDRSEPVSIWVQNNECTYTGTAPAEGYQCNTFVDKKPYIINPGETKTFSYTANSCKVIQIDVNTEDSSGCYTPDGQQWSGGLAYAINANNDGYPDDCQEPTKPPKNPKPPKQTPIPTVCATPGPVQNVKVTCPFCQQ